MTRAGGFQVFSLAEPSEEDGPEMKCKNKTRTQREGGGASLLSVSEVGAHFRSYHDGRTIELTPESSVAAQKALGSDIIIPLDELPPYHISRERLHASVRLSHRWMARSLRAHLSDQRQQAMYAVVHGGTDEELRAHSAAYLSSLPFDGYAIGGSLGKGAPARGSSPVPAASTSARPSAHSVWTRVPRQTARRRSRCSRASCRACRATGPPTCSASPTRRRRAP